MLIAGIVSCFSFTCTYVSLTSKVSRCLWTQIIVHSLQGVSTQIKWVKKNGLLTFDYWLVFLSLLLWHSWVSGRRAWPTGRQAQRAVFLWRLPIRGSGEINVWWIMFSAACQEDREQLSNAMQSRSANVPRPEQMYLLLPALGPLINRFTRFQLWLLVCSGWFQWCIYMRSRLTYLYEPLSIALRPSWQILLMHPPTSLWTLVYSSEED